MISSNLLLNGYFQAQNEIASLKEELARQKESHTETKQKLETANKEAKSSALMNLELEDYQRSMKTLEEQLTARADQLDQCRRENKVHQETVSQLRKELGMFGLVGGDTFYITFT